MKFSASLGAVAIVAASMGTAATALTLSQAAKPAETPPGSYSQDVYVDSRGCVYVRASIGSTVNWVPRLTRDRETVVCGLTPSAAVTAVSGRPPAPPAPPPPATLASMPPPATLASMPPPATLASMTTAAISAPATGFAYTAAASGATGPAAVTRTMNVSCPANGSSVRVQIGGDTVAVSCPQGMTRATSYVVTHADGSRSRLVAYPSGAGLATGAGVANGRVVVGGLPPGAPNTAFGNGYGVTTSAAPLDPVPNAAYTAVPAATARPVQVPDGYRPAWKDDRLNPNRGPRTPYGDAQMGTVLDTSKVPMPVIETATVRTVIGSKSQPDAAAPAPAVAPLVAPGARYVQVGAFGVPGNATKALANLRGLGFSAATSQTRSGLTLVMAGPFASSADLKRALSTLRGHYPDAYTRG